MTCCFLELSTISLSAFYCSKRSALLVAGIAEMHHCCSTGSCVTITALGVFLRVSCMWVAYVDVVLLQQFVVVVRGRQLMHCLLQRIVTMAGVFWPAMQEMTEAYSTLIGRNKPVTIAGDQVSAFLCCNLLVCLPYFSRAAAVSVLPLSIFIHICLRLFHRIVVCSAAIVGVVCLLGSLVVTSCVEALFASFWPVCGFAPFVCFGSLTFHSASLTCVFV